LTFDPDWLTRSIPTILTPTWAQFCVASSVTVTLTVPVEFVEELPLPELPPDPEVELCVELLQPAIASTSRHAELTKTLDDHEIKRNGNS
jgi:hypothetical protein